MSHDGDNRGAVSRLYDGDDRGAVSWLYNEYPHMLAGVSRADALRHGGTPLPWSYSILHPQLLLLTAKGKRDARLFFDDGRSVRSMLEWTERPGVTDLPATAGTDAPRWRLVTFAEVGEHPSYVGSNGFFAPTSLRVAVSALKSMDVQERTKWLGGNVLVPRQPDNVWVSLLTGGTIYTNWTFEQKGQKVRLYELTPNRRT